MAKRVYVTDAQSEAAQMIVSRSAASGRFVSPAVVKIANAEAPAAGKSSQSGGMAKTSVPSKGSRSAVPGRYVTQSSARGKFKSTVSRLARRSKAG